MIIKTDIYLSEFDAWSGAVYTLDRIKEEGKCDQLEAILEELYPEGMTDTELNDLLWFEPETIYEWLDIKDEDEEEDEEEGVYINGTWCSMEEVVWHHGEWHVIDEDEDEED